MTPEKENTFRALRDEPLLATQPLWCHVGLHRWTRYSEIKSRKEGVYHLDFQTRQCANCGVYDVKELRKIIS